MEGNNAVSLTCCNFELRIDKCYNDTNIVSKKIVKVARNHKSNISAHICFCHFLPCILKCKAAMLFKRRLRTERKFNLCIKWRRRNTSLQHIKLTLASLLIFVISNLKCCNFTQVDWGQCKTGAMQPSGDWEEWYCRVQDYVVFFFLIPYCVGSS